MSVRGKGPKGRFPGHHFNRHNLAEWNGISFPKQMGMPININRCPVNMFLDFNKRPVSAAQDKNSYLQSSAGSVVGFAW
jgi:hypothetical protein